MEQLQIIGNIGKDAQITTTNGSSKTFFSVGVDKSYTKDGAKVQNTQWYTVWKDPSGVDAYLKKGVKVFVQGGLNHKIEEYEGKQTVRLSIVNPKIELLSAKQESHE